MLLEKFEDIRVCVRVGGKDGIFLVMKEGG